MEEQIWQCSCCWPTRHQFGSWKLILIVPIQLEISYASVIREIIKKTQQKEHHLRKIQLDWDQRMTEENGMSDVKEKGRGERRNSRFLLGSLPCIIFPFST